MITPPKISIVIPVYNGKVALEHLLHTIEIHTQYPCYEVILVDDASDQEDMEAVYRRYEGRDRFLVIRNPVNLGFARTNNVGFLRASGEYVYLLNSDTLVTPGWLRKSMEFLERSAEIFPGVRLGAVQSKIILAQRDVKNLVVQTCGSVFNEKGEAVYLGHRAPANALAVNQAMLVDSFMGCGVLIPKSILDRVGGFDEAFGKYFFEDTDLSLRISELGYGIAYNPRSTIVHSKGGTTLRYVDPSAFQVEITRSLRYFKQKWPVERIKQALGRDRLGVVPQGVKL